MTITRTMRLERALYKKLASAVDRCLRQSSFEPLHVICPNVLQSSQRLDAQARQRVADQCASLLQCAKAKPACDDADTRHQLGLEALKLWHLADRMPPRSTESVASLSAPRPGFHPFASRQEQVVWHACLWAGIICLLLMLGVNGLFGLPAVVLLALAYVYKPMTREQIARAMKEEENRQEVPADARRSWLMAGLLMGMWAGSRSRKDKGDPYRRTYKAPHRSWQDEEE